MLNKFSVCCGALAFTLMSVGSNASAQAQHRGSPEDQLACTPDVYRLCSSYVPDEDAIVACLRRNIQALSPACHQVMARPDTPAPGGDDQDTD